MADTKREGSWTKNNYCPGSKLIWQSYHTYRAIWKGNVLISWTAGHKHQYLLQLFASLVHQCQPEVFYSFCLNISLCDYGAKHNFPVWKKGFELFRLHLQFHIFQPNYFINLDGFPQNIQWLYVLFWFLCSIPVYPY